MAELRDDARIHAKILYWGPEGAGKSTNLRHVHRKLRADHRGELRSEPTPLDPSVSSEVLPIQLGELGGREVHLLVTAPPGGPEHAPTRKRLLDEVDGVVLVVDASPDRLDANLESFEELRRSLSAYGRSLDDLALVVQYNKRDRADDLTLEELHRKLDLRGAAVFEAVATEGKGVLQALTTISKRVIRRLREMDLGGPEAAPPGAPPAPAGPAPDAGRTPAAPAAPAAAEPLPAPEPLVDPEPTPTPGSVEAALAAETPDPEADAAVRDAEIALGDSFGEVRAAVESEAGPAPLVIRAVGEARRTGDRSLAVPVSLEDPDGHRFAMTVHVSLEPGTPGDPAES